MQTLPHFSVFTLHTAVSPGKLTLAGSQNFSQCEESLRPRAGRICWVWAPALPVSDQALEHVRSFSSQRMWSANSCCYYYTETGALPVKCYLHENPQHFFKKVKHSYDPYFTDQKTSVRQILGSSRILPQSHLLSIWWQQAGETSERQFQRDSSRTKPGFWICFVWHTSYFKILE